MLVSNLNTSAAFARQKLALLTVVLSLAITSLGQAGDAPKPTPTNIGSPHHPTTKPADPAADTSTVTPGLTFRTSPDSETPYTFTSGETATTVAQPMTTTVAQTDPPRKSSGGGFDPLSPLGLAAGAAALAALAAMAWYIVKRQA